MGLKVEVEKSSMVLFLIQDGSTSREILDSCDLVHDRGRIPGTAQPKETRERWLQGERVQEVMGGKGQKREKSQR